MLANKHNVTQFTKGIRTFHTQTLTHVLSWRPFVHGNYICLKISVIKANELGTLFLRYTEASVFRGRFHFLYSLLCKMCVKGTFLANPITNGLLP